MSAPDMAGALVKAMNVTPQGGRYMIEPKEPSLETALPDGRKIEITGIWVSGKSPFANLEWKMEGVKQDGMLTVHGLQAVATHGQEDKVPGLREAIVPLIPTIYNYTSAFLADKAARDLAAKADKPAIHYT